MGKEHAGWSSMVKGRGSTPIRASVLSGPSGRRRSLEETCRSLSREYTVPRGVDNSVPDLDMLEVDSSRPAEDVPVTVFPAPIVELDSPATTPRMCPTHHLPKWMPATGLSIPPKRLWSCSHQPFTQTQATGLTLATLQDRMGKLGM